ncbi:MAG: host attachment protein [Phycisphaerales bacterium JB064]
MNNQDKRAMVAAVDERVARLYEAKPTLGKAIDLHEIASITNSHEREHERTRPDMMGGPGIRSAPGGSGIAGGPHLATPAESSREESRRFAKEVANWLRDRPERTSGDQLCVFAASRFLGMLRDEFKGPNANHIELREGEYAQMPVRELREHSAFREALPLT